MLWRQRWAHAEQVLGEQGVVLRSWRVGGDIMDEAVGIIRDAERRFKREERGLDENVRDAKRNGGSGGNGRERGTIRRVDERDR